MQHRHSPVVLGFDRAMMGVWVGQPLTDTGCHLRPPGWVLSKISSTPIPPIPPRPPSLNPRLTCSLTLTAHNVGSTGLYRTGRKKPACRKAVYYSPKPTWTCSVACGPICQAWCPPPINPPTRHCFPRHPLSPACTPPV